MSALTRLAATTAISLAFAGLPGCIVTGWNSTVEDTRIETATFDAGDAIDVHSRNGRVEIKRDSTDVATIVAEVRARTYERLEDMVLKVDRDGQGTLHVSIEPPNGRWENNEGASFDITLPGADGVLVDTGNGSVRISRLGGKADLSTSNGRVEVRDHDGDVRADTSNGSIIVRGADELWAHTSNGRIEATGVRASADLRTSNGSIELELDDDSTGPIELHASNGGIRVDLGHAFRGKLRGSTSNGRISFRDTEGRDVKLQSISKNKVDVVVGDGGSDSSASTSNGSLTIRFKS